MNEQTLGAEKYQGVLNPDVLNKIARTMSSHLLTASVTVVMFFKMPKNQGVFNS